MTGRDPVWTEGRNRGSRTSLTENRCLQWNPGEGRTAILLDKSDNYAMLTAIFPLPLHISGENESVEGLALGSSFMVGFTQAASWPRLSHSVIA